MGGGPESRVAGGTRFDRTGAGRGRWERAELGHKSEGALSAGTAGRNLNSLRVQSLQLGVRRAAGVHQFVMRVLDN